MPTSALHKTLTSKSSKFIWTVTCREITYLFSHLQYRSKGLQHYTRAMRMYYTHITRSVHAVPTQRPRSVHAPYTQIHQNACDFTQLELILHVKLLAVVQLELIKCV